MILCDMNQIILSNIFALTKKSEDIDKNLIRHVTLNSIRLFRNKFAKDYGEMVLVFDAGNYWRKDLFEHYKATRKIKQNQSETDWSAIFNMIHEVKEEIEENLPYKVMTVARAEADDIIAYLAKTNHQNEPVVIISSDKDFQQLQKYPGVKQFSPRTKKMVVCSNPQEFLNDHIIRGDSSDGIPNILSDADCFVNPDKRQKPLTKKVLSAILDDIAFNEAPKNYEDNWERNKSIIDMDSIPEWLEESIQDEWNKPIRGSRSNIFNYFVKNRLKNLMECIEEF